MARIKRPRKIGSHTNEQMKSALQLIQDGMTIRHAATALAIPYTTLRRYFQKVKTLNEEQVKAMSLTPNYSVNRVFSEEQEVTFKNYLSSSPFLFYGLTNLDCRKLAYEMAILNNLKFPECWKREKMAGVEWMRCFRARHPDLNLGSPKKVTSTRGVEAAIPPAIVFPKQKFKNDNMLKDDAGNLDQAVPSKNELFSQKMKHFTQHSNSCMKNSTMFDNHKSHLSIESFQMANSNRATSRLPFVKDEIEIENNTLQETFIKGIPKQQYENPISQIQQETAQNSLWDFEPSKETLITEKTSESQKYLRSLPAHSKTFSNESHGLNLNSIEQQNTKVEESLSWMRALIDVKAKGDGFAIFGKHIAQKLRSNANDENGIHFAKLLIDTFLQNFSDGVYNFENQHT